MNLREETKVEYPETNEYHEQNLKVILMLYYIKQHLHINYLNPALLIVVYSHVIRQTAL